MSATINCREFAEYFGTYVCGKMNPAYVFEVEGTPFTIEESYLDDLQNLFPYRVRTFLLMLLFSSLWCRGVYSSPQQVELPSSSDPQISPETYNLAISLIQSFDEMEGKHSR